MKRILYPIIILFFFIACKQKTAFSGDNLNNELVSVANLQIQQYYKDVKNEKQVVKVVYFHGNDVEPAPNLKERLSRVLNVVSDYYGEAFHKFDVEIDGVPFEKKGENYVIHTVEGDKPSQSYGIKSGYAIEQELIQKTAGSIDFSKDHVLIINGLWYRKNNGTYVFHSPYHGKGNRMNGVCHVADCELLDPKYLTDTISTMVFSEMFVKRKECLVAEFNSWYIGGIVHEMGHLFGLPHDFGNPAELDDAHLSMMGQYGSRHFRDYLWKGKVSSIFSSASIMQLISHPIFTQQSKFTKSDLGFFVENIQYRKNECEKMIVALDFEASERPYAAVALIRKTNATDYYNRSYVSLVQSIDSLTVELDDFEKGNYHMRFLFLFPEGNVREISKNIQVGEHSINETDATGIDLKDFYEKVKKLKAPKPVIDQALEVVQEALDPHEPVDIDTCTGQKLYLSDTKWDKAYVGWGKVARNYFSLESENGFFLMLKGKLFSKGLYAHSNSVYQFSLNGEWKQFSATVGIRDQAHIQGSAIFTVIGDGKVLYESPMLRVNQSHEINIEISGVSTLQLRAKGGEGHNHNSWAIWVDPVIER